jgi:hypothetical protein
LYTLLTARKSTNCVLLLHPVAREVAIDIKSDGNDRIYRAFNNTAVHYFTDDSVAPLGDVWGECPSEGYIADDPEVIRG